jgi:hypothetical protein
MDKNLNNFEKQTYELQFFQIGDHPNSASVPEFNAVISWNMCFVNVE